MGIEVESKLVVSGDDAEAVMRSVFDAEEISGHPLDPADTVRFRDRYLDRPDAALRFARVALRIREVTPAEGDPEARITVKGHLRTSPDPEASDNPPPSRRARTLAETRFEVEEPWSGPGYTAILRALVDAGVGDVAFATDHVAGSVFDGGDPLDTLRGAGFEVVQDRETIRHRRQVRGSTGPATPVAEVCLDTVTFRFGDAVIRHREIEVEAIDGGDPGHRGAVEAITATLLDRYPRSLRSWGPSKLETGVALERWAREGGLASRLGSGDVLLADAYPELEARCRVQGNDGAGSGDRP